MTRFKYSCAECGGPVTKKPCGTVKVGKTEEITGLHGWKCRTKCGPGVKVKRTGA